MPPRRLKREVAQPAVAELVEFTDRQLQFITHYVAWRKVTKAAIAAGCNPNTASSQGSTWLSDPRIAKEITKRIEAETQQLMITPRRILAEYEAIAFSNISDFTYIEDGKLYCDFSDITDRRQLVAIKEAEFDIEEIEEIEEDTGAIKRRIKLGKAKIKLHDKGKALDKLAEILKMTQAPVNLNFNQDNRQLNINMLDEDQRAQLRELLTIAAPTTDEEKTESS